MGAHHKVIASPGPIVRAIQVKLFCSETRVTRVFIDSGRNVDQFLPVFGGMYVDFDHTRVGSGFDMLQSIIIRRQITLHDDRNFQFGSGLFNFRQQFQIAFQMIHGWHENMQYAIACFKAHRRANDCWFQRWRFGFGFLFQVDRVESTPRAYTLQYLVLYVAGDMLRGLMIGRLLTKLIVFGEITGGFKRDDRCRGILTRLGCR